QAFLRKQLGRGPMPKSLPTLKMVAAPKGLPAGTLAVELSIPEHAFGPESADAFDEHGHRKPAKTTGPAVRIDLISMPDGARTWLGFGADPTLLSAHLLAVKTG